VRLRDSRRSYFYSNKNKKGGKSRTKGARLRPFPIPLCSSPIGLQPLGFYYYFLPLLLPLKQAKAKDNKNNNKGSQFYSYFSFAFAFTKIKGKRYKNKNKNLCPYSCFFFTSALWSLTFLFLFLLPLL
jgi:hypothetical protein